MAGEAGRRAVGPGDLRWVSLPPADRAGQQPVIMSWQLCDTIYLHCTALQLQVLSVTECVKTVLTWSLTPDILSGDQRYSGVNLTAVMGRAGKCWTVVY